ncbi:MAG: hypothetical protein U0T85_05880 [Cloacibacterium normanense]
MLIYNDILTNSEAAQYATYTFYENGVALTTAQAMNYTLMQQILL